MAERPVTDDAAARKSRQSLILAVLHALLAVAILAGFVYVQSHK